MNPRTIFPTFVEMTRVLKPEGNVQLGSDSRRGASKQMFAKRKGES